jgi:hypothetical protein
MKIIVLKGRGECGKSETIGIHLRELLTGMSIPREKWWRVKDHRECIKYGDKIIVLCPPGDNEEIVEKNTRFINANPCDVVFTTSRTRGGSWNVIKNYANQKDAELIEVWKHYDDDLNSGGQTKENQKLAEKLWGMI